MQTSHSDYVVADNPIKERIGKATQKSTTGITVDNGKAARMLGNRSYDEIDLLEEVLAQSSAL